MQQWEYVTRTLSAATLGAEWLRARLGELGAEGWELVAALPVGGGAADHHTYVFKRPTAAPAPLQRRPLPGRRSSETVRRPMPTRTARG